MESARKEEQAREREDGAKKAKRMQKGREKAHGNEGRGNSGSGKTSPVPMEDAAAKVTKDDDKENQRKALGKKASVKQSVEPPVSEAAATNVYSKTKKIEDRKGLKEFPSLTTFKPLSDETVTPSWAEDKTLSAAKEGSKKKKKKKKDSGFTIEEPESAGFTIEEPESEFDLYSGLKNVDEKKSVSSESPVQPLQQPMWNVSSGNSSALPTNVSSTYTKQPASAQATSVALTSTSQSTWATNVLTAPRGQPPQSTWASNISSTKKSQPAANVAWSNKSSTPDLGDSGDFPTLSSIASLLGGTTSSKKSKTANQSNDTSKKQPESEKNATKPPTRNKAAETEKVAKEVAAKVNVSQSTNGPRPPPGLSLAPSNNAIKKVPPGFSQAPKAQPPPGFSTSVPLSNVAPNPNLDYIQPVNYMQRNLVLLQKIKDYLGNDDSKLMIFKTVSGEFRKSTITPAEYYQHCLDLLGADNLPKIFSELVSLLPDVVKQQELLTAANDYKIQQKMSRKEDKVLKISGSKGQSNQKKSSGGKAWGNTAEHSTCTQCGQVMLKVDMEAHLNSHQDFPSLMSSVKTKAKPVMAPAWGRIK